jgi:hypothetical protein
MNAFLGVAKGRYVRNTKWPEADGRDCWFLFLISDEPLRFLEIQYKGGKEGDAPLGLVGKGVTFDS